MTYTFELNEVDQKFAETYAAEIGKTVGELAKESMLEHIEDVMDLRLYEQAKAEYEADPVTYSFDEIKKNLIKRIEGELMGDAV
ncbi:MAG: hypothetical protein IJR94_00175 [Synergistaceae bacterium]|nr:hypothetical protein [Synergistaceae bacterium]